MSLYTPPSLIRKLMLEAEDLTLAPSDNAQQVDDFTNGSSPDQVAADMATAAAPVGGVPGLQGSTLSMPQVATPASTISKTVINKDIILAQLSELKSIVTNYEKQFEGDDLTPEDANVKISGLLSTLVFHAEKLNSFMEAAPAGEGDIAPAMETPSMDAPMSDMPAISDEPITPPAPMAEPQV